MSTTTYTNQFSPKGTDEWSDLDLREFGYRHEFASIDEAHSTLRLVADSTRYDYRLVVAHNGQREVI